MARNWTVKEAIEVLESGTDIEAITDIGRRCPLFVYFYHKSSQVVIKAMGKNMTAKNANKRIDEFFQPEVEEEEEELEGFDRKVKKIKKEKIKKGKVEEDDDDEIDDDEIDDDDDDNDKDNGNEEELEDEIDDDDDDDDDDEVKKGKVKKTKKEKVKKTKKEKVKKEKVEEEDDNLDFDVEDLLED